MGDDLSILPDGRQRAREAIENERRRARGEPERAPTWWRRALAWFGVRPVDAPSDDDDRRAPPDALY